MTVLVGLITSILGSVSGLLGTALLFLGPLGQALGSIISGISGAFLHPITYTAWLLLYFDLRARKEGFDLSLTADRLFAAENAQPAD